MKKIILLLCCAVFLTACSAGTTTTTTEETTAVSINKAEQLMDEYTSDPVEANDEDTGYAIALFAHYYDDVLNCTSVDQVPEEYLIAISYFYSGFNVSSPAGEVGFNSWYALIALEDNQPEEFNNYMTTAKDSFENALGMTIDEFNAQVEGKS